MKLGCVATFVANFCFQQTFSAFRCRFDNQCLLCPPPHTRTRTHTHTHTHTPTPTPPHTHTVIHSKDLVAILHLLVALARRFRCQYPLPRNVAIKRIHLKVGIDNEPRLALIMNQGWLESHHNLRVDDASACTINPFWHLHVP